MRQLFARSDRRRQRRMWVEAETSTNKMWWTLGARAMHDKVLEQFTAWAIACPNPVLADDLWDYVEKLREVKVDYERDK